MAANIGGSLFSMAWRNIWRNKRRSWLTISGIGFSALIFVFFMPIQYGTYDVLIDISLRVFPGYAQVQKPGYQDDKEIQNTIDGAEELAAKIRNSNEFEGVAVRAFGFALLSSAKRSYGAQVVGVQSRYESELSFIPDKITKGRFLTADDANEVVIGAALARNLKVKVGDELTMLGSGKDGSIAAAILPIVGIFESGDNQLDRYMVQIPLHTFQYLFSMGDSAHSIAVVGKSMNEIDAVPQKLRQLVEGYDHLVVLDWTELVPGIKQGLEIDKLSGLFILIILVAIVVFSIFNTFLMSVLERTKEFGLMLALGARPGNISRLVMVESLLLSVLGLLIGISLGVAINLYLLEEGLRIPGLKEVYESYNIPIVALYPKIDLFTVLFGPSVIFIATNVAAWIPLLRIHRLQPTEAMRTV